MSDGNLLLEIADLRIRVGHLRAINAELVAVLEDIGADTTSSKMARIEAVLARAKGETVIP